MRRRGGAEIDKAREAKEGVIKDLNEPSQAILNSVYTSLKKGEIDSEKYYEILSVLKTTNGNVTQQELNQDVPEGFMDYLNEHRAQIAQNLGVPIMHMIVISWDSRMVWIWWVNKLIMAWTGQVNS